MIFLHNPSANCIFDFNISNMLSSAIEMTVPSETNLRFPRSGQQEHKGRKNYTLTHDIIFRIEVPTHHFCSNRLHKFFYYIL